MIIHQDSCATISKQTKVFADVTQIAALKAYEGLTGIPVAEQIRRALDTYMDCTIGGHMERLDELKSKLLVMLPRKKLSHLKKISS